MATGRARLSDICSVNLILKNKSIVLILKILYEGKKLRKMGEESSLTSFD